MKLFLLCERHVISLRYVKVPDAKCSLQKKKKRSFLSRHRHLALQDLGSVVGSQLSVKHLFPAGISAPNSYEDDQSDVGLGMQLSVTSDRHSAEFLPDELLDAITDYSPDWSYAEVRLL